MESLLRPCGCNIGCKTLFSERGKLLLKLTCPAGTSTCPATLLNKGEIGLSPKHCLLSGASLCLVQLAPLLFFAEFICNLQRGQWLCCMLNLQRGKWLCCKLLCIKYLYKEHFPPLIYPSCSCDLPQLELLISDRGEREQRQKVNSVVLRSSAVVGENDRRRATC